MWILVIMLGGGVYSTSPAIDHIEFSSQEKCQAALTAIYDKRIDLIHEVCVQK